MQVIVDMETGVNYLFLKAGYGAGLTLLLDADGRECKRKIKKQKIYECFLKWTLSFDLK